MVSIAVVDEWSGEVILVRSLSEDRLSLLESYSEELGIVVRVFESGESLITYPSHRYENGDYKCAKIYPDGRFIVERLTADGYVRNTLRVYVPERPVAANRMGAHLDRHNLGL